MERVLSLFARRCVECEVLGARRAPASKMPERRRFQRARTIGGSASRATRSDARAAVPRAPPVPSREVGASLRILASAWRPELWLLPPQEARGGGAPRRRWCGSLPHLVARLAVGPISGSPEIAGP